MYTDTSYEMKTLTVQGLLNRKKNNNRKLLNTNSSSSSGSSSSSSSGSSGSSSKHDNSIVYPLHGIGFSNGGIFLTKIATFTQNRPKRRKNADNDSKNRVKFSSMILMSAGNTNTNTNNVSNTNIFIDIKAYGMMLTTSVILRHYSLIWPEILNSLSNTTNTTTITIIITTINTNYYYFYY